MNEIYDWAGIIVKLSYVNNCVNLNESTSTLILCIGPAYHQFEKNHVTFLELVP